MTGVLIIRSVGLGLAAALVVAVGATILRGGFGAHEIPLVVMYAVPPAIFTGVGAIGIRSIGRSRPALGYTAAIVAGVIVGLGWTYAVAFALGGWFLAIGVPSLPVWIAGAVAGLTAGVPARAQATSLGLAVMSGVLSAALLSGALLALREARQHPGFVAAFRPQVTTDERNEVSEEVLATPTNRGFELLPGIRSLRATSYEGQYAIAIDFWPGATDEEIESVRVALDGSTHRQGRGRRWVARTFVRGAPIRISSRGVVHPGDAHSCMFTVRTGRHDDGHRCFPLIWFSRPRRPGGHHPARDSERSSSCSSALRSVRDRHRTDGQGGRRTGRR